MAMSTCNTAGLMNANLIRVFEDRLKRIVEECYEVAFVLCNAEMEEFGSAKLFDVFNQTFTTAYCLNTGYWPFYSSVSGQCLCTCGRFGVPCRHAKSEHHWIDMRPVEHQQGAPVFYPRVYGQVLPLNYDLIIKPVQENSYAYSINIIVNVQYKRSAGRPVRRVAKTNREILLNANGDVYSQIFSIQVFARYYIHREYYGSLFTVVYQPNPFYHEHYGTYFKELLFLRNRDPQLFNMQPQIYCLTNSQVPSSTFILQHVNVPTYIPPTQISAFQPGTIYCRQKFARKMRNKSSQTPWKVCCDSEDGSCRLKDVANIWSYYSDGSEILSQSLRELATTPSQEFVIDDRADDFMEIHDSEEYDNQLPTLGYDKVIRPNTLSYHPSEEVPSKPHTVTSNCFQGVKRRHSGNTPWRQVQVTPKMVEEFTKSCEEADSTVNEEVTSEREFPSLCTDYAGPSTSGLNFSRAVKNARKTETNGKEEKDAEWFNRNFPPLKPITTKSDIDEEFELIEIVIKEDGEKEKEKEKGKGKDGEVDWWNPKSEESIYKKRFT